MIGLSLSMCVSDIADGIVLESDVKKIVADTCAYNPELLDKLMSDYNFQYWKSKPNAEQIARRMFTSGKIEQPRVDGKVHPGYCLANYRQFWIK